MSSNNFFVGFQKIKKNIQMNLNFYIFFSNYFQVHYTNFMNFFGKSFYFRVTITLHKYLEYERNDTFIL